jgi:hypothetical protein
MRIIKTLIKLLILSGLFSCVNDSSKKNTASSDTALVAKTVSAAKILKNDTLEQAQIAYGTLKFGTTPEECRRLYENNFHDLIHSNYTFGASYNGSKQLFMLSLEGLIRLPNYRDSSIKNQWQTLIDTITKRFGEPDSTYPYPDHPILKQEQIQWTDIWSLATRKIKIGIIKSSKQYYAICRIYDEPMFNEAQKENASDNEKKDKK